MEHKGLSLEAMRSHHFFTSYKFLKTLPSKQLKAPTLHLVRMSAISISTKVLSMRANVTS